MSNHANQTVAVTGATGFLGRHTVRALVEAGHTVRALARDPHRARQLLGDTGAHVVLGSAFDRGALTELVQGAGAVVHTIGIRREAESGQTFDRIHVGATERVTAAARAAGARRMVHVSALGVRPGAPTAYQRSKHEAERIVRASGLDWTILRPSLIHGPDGEFIGMVRQWVMGRAAPRFFLPYFTRVTMRDGMPPRPEFESATVQPIHVDDVAAAIVSALGEPESIGEVYPLVGPETLEWPELLTAIRDALPMGSKTIKPRGIPAPLGRALAVAAKPLGFAEALPFGPSEPVMATENATASPAKARVGLGLHPRPFFESLAAYADQV